MSVPNAVATGWGVRFRHPGVIALVMTLFESVALVGWIYGVSVLSGGDVYATTAIFASGGLFIALTAENLSLFHAAGGRSLLDAPILAATEVLLWLQWLIIIDHGLYSRTGAGPAVAIAALLLVIQHSAELSALDGRPPFTELTGAAIGGSVLEALAVTAYWVLAIEGGRIGVGLAALFGLLLIEHRVRTHHVID